MRAVIASVAALLALAALAQPAQARPHRGHHRSHEVAYQAVPCGNSGRWCAISNHPRRQTKRVSRSRRASTYSARRHRYPHAVRTDGTGCRVYLGCGCHLAAHLGVPNPHHALDSARRWLQVGARARRGCVGCVVVLSRGRGGHVGKVRGYDAHGNPVVYSWGNRRVGWFVKTYSRHRVLGYRRI